MTWTVSSEVNAAALNGITGLFDSGSVRLENSSSSELATIGFGATAFGAATNASPAVATANARTPDTLVVSGTVAFIDFRTSDSSSRLRGTVGISGSGADFIVDDPDIPSGTDSIDFEDLVFSLQVRNV